MQIQNENLLRTLSGKCRESLYGTAEEAIDDLSVPRVKTTKPYVTYPGKLTIGDPMKYPDTAIMIDVERYFRTKMAKPASASSFVSRSAAGPQSAESSMTIGGEKDAEHGLSAVRTTRTYQVNDGTAPGGKKDVDPDELAKGFAYGRTAVHISEAEQNITRIETSSSFTIIGFIPNDKVGFALIRPSAKTNCN